MSAVRSPSNVLLSEVAGGYNYARQSLLFCMMWYSGSSVVTENRQKGEV